MTGSLQPPSRRSPPRRGCRQRRFTRPSAASRGWSAPSANRHWPAKGRSRPRLAPTTCKPANPIRAKSSEAGAGSRPRSPPVSPILLLLRAAALTDPQMAILRGEIEASRLTRMIRNARALADGGHLRAGMTTKHAGEIMWTYSSPDLYELLVVTRRWPPQEYGTFIADAMIAALLPPQPPAPQPSQDPDCSPFHHRHDRLTHKRTGTVDLLDPGAQSGPVAARPVALRLAGRLVRIAARRPCVSCRIIAPRSRPEEDSSPPSSRVQDVLSCHPVFAESLQEPPGSARGTDRGAGGCMSLRLIWARTSANRSRLALGPPPPRDPSRILDLPTDLKRPLAVWRACVPDPVKGAP